VAALVAAKASIDGPNRACIRSAADRDNSDETWLYVLSLMPICEWLNVPMITRAGTPCASISDAAVCRTPSAAWLPPRATEPATSTSTDTYLLPVVAVLLGALVLHEPITTRLALGVLVVLGGVALTRRGQATKADASPMNQPRRLRTAD
jgi:hypothetical protein